MPKLSAAEEIHSAIKTAALYCDPAMTSAEAAQEFFESEPRSRGTVHADVGD
jgi:hypothetical protein